MKKCPRPAKADFKGKTNHVTAHIILIRFKEGKNHLVYSPHLEVTGYGKTKKGGKRIICAQPEDFFGLCNPKENVA